jgi:hypothetical protein
VDVDLTIDQKESGVFRSMRRSRTYNQGVYTQSPTASFPYDMHNIRSESFDCFTYFEHPYTRNVYNEMRKVLGKDDEQYTSLLKESVPFILEQCIGIWTPLPYNYRVWWPWLKKLQWRRVSRYRRPDACFKLRLDRPGPESVDGL